MQRTWKDAGEAVLAVAALGVAAWLYARDANAVDTKRSGDTAEDMTQLIGNTPVVRLNRLSQLTGCDIWAKLELANPGGSAKDRIALAIVQHAESAGMLRPGHRDRVFEGTSGSTGISLALVCRAKGYEAHIVMPDDTSPDKVNLLRSYGAQIHLVKPAGIADRGHYVNVARRLAQETNTGNNDTQAIFANQFEDIHNWQAHFASTGPEIAAQVPKIDCFVHGAGTGGTIAGVARFMKQTRPELQVVLADVPGSGLYNKVHYGVMYNATEREGHRRRHQVDTAIEGIGLNRITANFSAGLDLIDDAIRVEDADARYMASQLVDTEGLLVGSSSAVNCVAVLRKAKQLGPGHTLVTILCDSGTRHLSKFFALPIDTDCLVAKEMQELSLARI